MFLLTLERRILGKVVLAGQSLKLLVLLFCPLKLRRVTSRPSEGTQSADSPPTEKSGLNFGIGFQFPQCWWFGRCAFIDIDSI